MGYFSQVQELSNTMAEYQEKLKQMEHDEPTHAQASFRNGIHEALLGTATLLNYKVSQALTQIDNGDEVVSRRVEEQLGRWHQLTEQALVSNGRESYSSVLKKLEELPKEIFAKVLRRGRRQPDQLERDPNHSLHVLTIYDNLIKSKGLNAKHECYDGIRSSNWISEYVQLITLLKNEALTSREYAHLDVALLRHDLDHCMKSQEIGLCLGKYVSSHFDVSSWLRSVADAAWKDICDRAVTLKRMPFGNLDQFREDADALLRSVAYPFLTPKARTYLRKLNKTENDQELRRVMNAKYLQEELGLSQTPPMRKTRQERTRRKGRDADNRKQE